MNHKQVVKWLPSSVVISLIVTLFISSLSGIWLAEMLGYISEFSSTDEVQRLYWFVILFISGLLFFFCNSVVSKYIKAASLKTLNKKMKIALIEEDFYRKDEEIGQSPNQQVSKIINDFKLIEENYFSVLFDTFGYLVMSLSSIAYLLHLDVLLGVLFAISSFLSFLPSFLGEKYMLKCTEKWTKSSSVLLQKLNDLFRGLLTIKTYQAKKNYYFRLLKELKKNEKDNSDLSYSYVAISILAEASSSIGEMFPFAVALYFVFVGEIEVGVIISMHYARDRVAFPLRFSAQNISKINSTKEIRKELGNILNANEHRILTPFRMLEYPTIHLNDVTVGYNQNTPLLRKVSLKIDYGQKVLITGKSGVGKSTLLDALQGQSVLQSGEILYKNEEQVIDAKQVLYSNLIARIHQNVFIYSETLAYNITLGKEYKKERLINIVKKVGLYDELGGECLEKTYGEEGSELSGGQKQRVEIARALFHNKKIFLVDEATAALDESLAKKIRNVLYSLPETVIEVAHHYDDSETCYNNLEHFNIEGGKLQKIAN